MELVTCYKYDDDGYYIGPIDCMKKSSGLVILPPNTVVKQPKLNEGYWYKWTGKVWRAEKKPETLEELMNFDIEINDESERGKELLKLVEALITDDYKTVQDGDYIRIEKVSDEEIERRELREQELEQATTIAQIKDMLVTAILADDDTDTIEELKSMYKEIM